MGYLIVFIMPACGIRQVREVTADLVSRICVYVAKSIRFKMPLLVQMFMDGLL